MDTNFLQDGIGALLYAAKLLDKKEQQCSTSRINATPRFGMQQQVSTGRNGTQEEPLDLRVYERKVEPLDLRVNKRKANDGRPVPPDHSEKKWKAATHGNQVSDMQSPQPSGSGQANQLTEFFYPTDIDPQKVQLTKVPPHTGKNPYKCPKEDCMKVFSSNKSLKKHMNVHAGSFRCHLCNFNAISNWHLNRHNASYWHIRTEAKVLPLEPNSTTALNQPSKSLDINPNTTIKTVNA